MRPTGAVPFQMDWKGIHAAGRLPTPPFTYLMPYNAVYRISAGSLQRRPDSYHPLEAGSAPRDMNPGAEENNRKVNSGTGV
jgi:hypothetical protein